MTATLPDDIFFAVSTISQSRIFWNRKVKKILLVYEFV